MPKKQSHSKAKTSKAEPSSNVSKEPLEHITIHGHITAHRDVVIGDQFNISQITRIDSQDKFVKELQHLQQEIVKLSAQSPEASDERDRLHAAVLDVDMAVRETQQARPLGERISDLLRSAKSKLDTTKNTLKSAVELGTILISLSHVAMKLFGS